MCDNIDIVNQAINGNKEAFCELISKNKSEIYKIAFLYTKHEQDSLDIFQDTVYKAFKSIKTIKNPEYFNTWIIRITINCCKNFIKSKKHIINNELLYINDTENDIDKIADTGSDVFNDASKKIDLLNALDKLDDNLKTIVILRYYNDLQLNQIAEILSCPVSTVKTRLYRALDILRHTLHNYL